MMTDMQETISGGLVYEYSEHSTSWSSGYGIASTRGSVCWEGATTTWTEAAGHLLTAYASDAFAEYANAEGAWDEDSAAGCLWRPPTALAHQRPTCPSDLAGAE